MNKKIARIRALVIGGLFSVLMISPALTLSHVSAKAPRDTTKAVRITFPDDPEAIYDTARIVHNVTVNGEKECACTRNSTCGTAKA
jgi:hypothetical protein